MTAVLPTGFAVIVRLSSRDGGQEPDLVAVAQESAASPPPCRTLRPLTKTPTHTLPSSRKMRDFSRGSAGDAVGQSLAHRRPFALHAGRSLGSGDPHRQS